MRWRKKERISGDMEHGLGSGEKCLLFPPQRILRSDESENPGKLDWALDKLNSPVSKILRPKTCHTGFIAHTCVACSLGRSLEDSGQFDPSERGAICKELVVVRKEARESFFSG